MSAASSMEWLRPTSKGDFRCWWPGDDVPYQKYHDTEWGVAVIDDQRLYEKVCLEGFQSGLSWLTILRKRENFRSAFAAFELEKVARFNDNDVQRLMADAGIVRHRGKIEATINNAARALELIEETGSLAKHFGLSHRQFQTVEMVLHNTHQDSQRHRLQPSRYQKT